MGTGGGWGAAAFLLIAVCCAALIRTVSIPRDWLPDQWADFDFWPTRLQEAKENILRYVMLPKSAPETERLRQALQTAAGGLGACFLSLTGSRPSVPGGR